MFAVRQITTLEHLIADNYILFGIAVALILSALNALVTSFLFMINTPVSPIQPNEFASLVAAIMFPIVLSVEIQTRYSAATDIVASIDARDNLLIKSLIRTPTSSTHDVQTAIDRLYTTPSSAQLLATVQPIIVERADLLSRLHRIGAGYGVEANVRTTMYIFEFVITVIIVPVNVQSSLTHDMSGWTVFASAFTTCLLHHAWIQSALLALIFNTSHTTTKLCNRYTHPR